MTAVNKNYYGSLQATLFNVHKYLPNHTIIVYDLGLDEAMVLTVEWRHTPPSRLITS